MIDQHLVFAYRCARLNSYVQTYLASKQIQYLIGSQSILNYLFNSVSPPDVYVIITGTQFKWLTKQSTAIKQLLDNIKALPNHCIFTSSTALTAGNSIQTNDGFQMDDKQYMELLADQNAPLCIKFENEKISELQAFINQSIPDGSFMASDCDSLDIKNRKINNVQKSLYQLVFAHIDCGKVLDLIKSAGQIKSMFRDVQQAISEQNNDKINKSYRTLDSGDKQSESTVQVKDIVRINKDKKQVKLPGKIYDIHLKHPLYPIISRSPYIIEDRSQPPVEGLIFSGAITQLINDQGFTIIAKALNRIDTIEEDVMPILKKFLMANLIKSLPLKYHQTVQTTINTLKLLIQNVQTDGSEQIFNRCISNVSISLQVRHVNDQGADIVTLIFGKSFISTPLKFILLNEFQTYDFFNVFGTKDLNRVNLSFKNCITKLQMENLSQKLVLVKFGIIEENSKILKLGTSCQQAIIQQNQFTIQLNMEHLTEIFIPLQPKYGSKVFAQYAQMAAKVEPEDQQFEYQIINKQLILITENIDAFQRYFGNFILGSVISLNQSKIQKFCISFESESVQIKNEIIKYMESNVELESASYNLTINESTHPLLDITQVQQEIFDSDIDFIFKQEAKLDYNDKLIEKQIKTPLQNSNTSLIIIPFNLPDFPYFSVFKNLQRFARDLGQPFSSVKVTSEEEFSKSQKLISSSQTLVCVLAYLPFVSRIVNSRNYAKIQIFSFQRHPNLLLNMMGAQELAFFTSIGYFGITENPVYFSHPQKFLFDFNMQKLAVQELSGQVFVSKNIFSEEFLEDLQIRSFPAEFGIKPVVLNIRSERFTLKKCDLKLISEFMRNKSYCVDVLKRLQRQISECVSKLFIPSLSMEIFDYCFTVDFEENFIEGCESYINSMNFVNVNVKKAGLEQTIIEFMGCLFSEFGEKKTNVVPSKQELQAQFDDVPLPYGWVKDGQTYVSWGGEFSPVRPDLDELIEKQKKNQ